MARPRFYPENGIEITSVGSFLDYLKDKQENDGDSSITYFFRGQAKEYWDISSSIFRENMLGIEHELLKIPLTKIPTEFDSSQSAFDLMTKYQHYGLCTRLLDITTNPLVALYFACKIMGNEKYEKENPTDEAKEEAREPWGVIYYKKAYPDYADNTAVKIVATMAQYNLENKNSIKEIINKLFQDNVITEEDKNKWSKPENYSNFIDIIQNNYTIIPICNNTRLTKQNGAFLLPSMFSISKDKDEDEYKIIKTAASLREEFEQEIFYIDGDNKEKILKELDICNINEYTLFPELEHQLNYIKTSNAKTYYAPSFVKYTKESENTTESILVMNNYETSKEFKDAFKLDLKSLNNEKLEEIIYTNIFNYLQVDWYKKKSIQSNMKFKIVKNLLKEKFSKEDAYAIANEWIEKAKNIIEKYSSKQEEN